MKLVANKLDRYKVEQRFTPDVIPLGDECLAPRGGFSPKRLEVPEVSEVSEVSMDAEESDGWHREAMLEPSRPPKEYSRKEMKEGVRSKVRKLVQRIAQDRGYTMKIEDRPRSTE